MDRRAYELANEIKTEPLAEKEDHSPCLEQEAVLKYQNAILAQIQKEREDKKMEKANKAAGANRFPGTGRWAAAAACAAILIFGVAVFGGEVHAVIQRISWSIGSALGLSGELEEYRNVVGIPISDGGYVITLQEVVAAEEKLVVNYTVQREDGEPMEQVFIPLGGLFVNGKEVRGEVFGSGEFLDEAQTVVGVAMSYDMLGVDMSRENTYQLKFHEIGEEDVVKGKWYFQFTARGEDLIADTRRISIQREFTLGENAAVTLDTLELNDLEQRISFHGEGISGYILMLMAKDDTGREVEFDTKTFRAQSGKGYMQNQEVLYDGRIGETAGRVTMTLYAVEAPKESGQIGNDYKQVGETFEVILD